MISDLSAKLFKRYHSDKHFSEFLPTRWRQKSTGIDMEQNYVTVTLCIGAMGHYFPVSQNGNLVVLALLQFTD